MKIKSISGFVLMVKDLKETEKFYKKLGFRFGQNREEGQLTAYINWFWVQFVQANNFRATGNDGQYVYLAVDDIDETYQELKDMSLEATSPEEFKSGRRETMISDPDGYKLVFFTKK